MADEDWSTAAYHAAAAAADDDTKLFLRPFVAGPCRMGEWTTSWKKVTLDLDLPMVVLLRASSANLCVVDVHVGRRRCVPLPWQIGRVVVLVGVAKMMAEERCR